MILARYQLIAKNIVKKFRSTLYLIFAKVRDPSLFFLDNH